MSVFFKVIDIQINDCFKTTVQHKIYINFDFELRIKNIKIGLHSINNAMWAHYESKSQCITQLNYLDIHKLNHMLVLLVLGN